MRICAAAVVLFGSLASAQSTVTTLSTITPPTARRSTGFAEDPLGTGIFAFGGYLGPGSVDNTLLYFLPGTNAWLAVAAGGALPIARENHGLAVDSLGQVVIFGGFNASNAGLDDVWIFNPATQLWTGPLQPATRPSVRGMGVFYYVPQWSGFLQFGGISQGFFGTRNNQLWKLDTADGGATWNLVTPGGSVPNIRDAMCTGFDADAGVLYLFGGEAGNGGNNANDTYHYDVNTNVFSLANPTGNIPSARSFAQCAWDPISRRLLLYGGQTSNPIGGAFAYDPATRVWSDVTPVSNPGVRSDGSAVHFSRQPGMLFFGGRTGASSYTNATVHMFLPGVDAGADAGTDAGFDAGVDAGFDAGVDAGLDAGGDAGATDAGVTDAGEADSGVVFADAGMDAGVDAGQETDAGGGGADAGTDQLDGGSLSEQQRRELTVGCGCGAGPGGAAMLFALVIALRRSRFRRP